MSWVWGLPPCCPRQCRLSLWGNGSRLNRFVGLGGGTSCPRPNGGLQVLVWMPRSKQEPLVSCRAWSPAARGNNVLLPQHGAMRGQRLGYVLEGS